MWANNLKRGQTFKVNGWYKEVVLTVLMPIEKNIKLCIKKEGSTGIEGLGILAGEGSVNLSENTAKDLYCLPATTEVTPVN